MQVACVRQWSVAVRASVLHSNIRPDESQHHGSPLQQGIRLLCSTCLQTIS
jgi:hypothetical protein